MSMQNLAAASAANLQLFSKALQESAAQQQAEEDQSGTGQNQPAISAADLQHFMLSQLDQQLYLSQLANGFGGGPETTTTTTASSAASSFFPSATSDTATTATTASSNNGRDADSAHAEMVLKQANGCGEFAGSSSGDGAAANETLAQRAQLAAQQNLMEQLLEVAAGGNPLADAANGGGAADELGQLMAQLMGGTGGELQTALLAQQLVNGRGDVQSPSQQNGHQQQLSLLDQLQMFQMLGGQGAGLADLLAGGTGSHHHQFPPNCLDNDGGGPPMKGGSPNKDADTYCEICNKNVCNRYFLKTHKEKKHGIFTGSPTKFNAAGNDVRQFFGQHMEEQQQPGRAQSASLHARDSPSTGHQPQNRQKQSICSTPGMGVNTTPHQQGANTTTTTTNASSLNEDALSSSEQLMSQCIMQQLAAQLGLPAQNGAGQEGRPLIEQLLGTGLPLAELLQQQPSNGLPGRRSPSASPQQADQHHQQLPCAQCPKQFPSQSALFQHQLTEHIGGEQQSPHNDQQQQQHPLTMRWPMGGEMGGSGGATGATMPQQQQQQFLGQLLGSSPFPSSNNASSLMLPSSFGSGGASINAAELDGAAMLAKLSAELAAASQGGSVGGHHHQQGGGGGPLLHQQMNGATGGGGSGGGGQANKVPPQKRQYQSTSKNFCDLCNKEVCNKYFLRTHMLKMHNIVIDENKVVIANIDTSEKEKRGEVKFRCEICGNSMGTRDQLKQHKREVHGMQPIGPMPTPPSSKSSTGLPPSKSHQFGTTGANAGGVGAMETATTGGGEGGQKLMTTSGGGPFPIVPFGMAAGEHAEQQHIAGTMAANDENQPIGAGAAERATMMGAAGAETSSTSALPSSVKQLLNQLIGGGGGDTQLTGTQTGQQRTPMNVRREFEGGDPSTTPQQQSMRSQQQNGHAHHRQRSDANNNSPTTCRFCGLCLESEEHLQLHHLMNHLDLVPANDEQRGEGEEAEEKLVTQVALQMAEANRSSQKQAVAALRKSSAASSGASSSSSSSAASSAPSAASSSAHAHQVSPMAPATKMAVAAHPCALCKRRYKSEAKLEQHQRMVHHKFVAKISPTKRSVKISPKKVARMVKCFTCMKCQRRFGTKMECNEHVISVHIRSEQPPHQFSMEEGASSPPMMKRAKLEDVGEEEEDQVGRSPHHLHHHHHGGLLREWVREEEGKSSGHGEDMGGGRLVVDEGEDEDEEEDEKEGGSGDGDGKAQKHHGDAVGKEGGEKHSHTSGSTSPVSVHAASSHHSCLAMLPEGFAHPHADHQKPFILQSFTVRPSMAGGPLPEELVAYFPVRSTQNEPLRITLELQPNPQLDAQVRHV